MRVRAYVLIVSVALLGMSAGSKKATLTEGSNPGDLAPSIEFLEKDGQSIRFQNQAGRYTLIHFWAAYDAESRMHNVLLANKVATMGSDKVRLCAISLDERESVFSETIKIDQLDHSSQYYMDEAVASKVSKKYHLNKGLRNFLIDDHGVIVATNVDADQLEQRFKK